MIPRRFLHVLLAVVFALAATACSGTDPDSNENGNDMNTTTELVCGLLSPDLVRRVVGDAPIDSRGFGASTKDGPAQCTIQDGEGGQTVMQLSIGVVEPSKWTAELEKESKAPYGQCTKRYDGDPGTGYGCTYDSGIYVAGAAVHVLKRDRLIRATVYNWADATPEERLGLAEDVARDLDKNYRPEA